jgi:hypothetical protein
MDKCRRWAAPTAAISNIAPQYCRQSVTIGSPGAAHFDEVDSSDLKAGMARRYMMWRALNGLCGFASTNESSASSNRS